MKNKYFAGLTIGLLLGVFANANAGMTVIPIDLTSWTYVEESTNGSWEMTSDGIKFYGSSYRQGGAIVANTMENFSDATIYIKWMADGGSGNYMGLDPYIGIVTPSGWTGGIYADYTTGWSWNGSKVLPQDTWLYTRIVTNPNMTWEYITALGNYDNQGGSALYDSSFSWQPTPQQWQDYVVNGHVAIALWDNYGGTSAWELISEAKYVISSTSSSVPEPATLLLFSIGIIGLIGTRLGRGNRIAPVASLLTAN